MTQILQLLQKGNRTQPTIYRFGANETLCLYYDQAGTIEICDTAGKHIRTLSNDDVRNMGYSPAKLIAGNEQDQLLHNYKSSLLSRSINTVRALLFAVMLGVAMGVVSNITGCSDYIAQQIDKDVAVTTIHPVENYYATLDTSSAEQDY